MEVGGRLDSFRGDDVLDKLGKKADGVVEESARAASLRRGRCAPRGAE